MSEIKKVELRKKEIIDDVICDICDICENSCCVNEIIINNELRLDNGTKHKTFEYLELKNRWGYYTNKDEQYWEAHVCEKCVDEHLSKLIKFKKYEYHWTSGEVNYNKPINE